MKKSSVGISQLKLLTKNTHSVICQGVDNAHRTVIVKSPRMDVQHDWAFDRLVSEAHTLRHLRGINGIPQLENFFWLRSGKNKRPVLVTQKMQGITLHELRKQQRGYRLSIAETITLLHAIASVLYAAHCRGIVHGDVKLGNILVTPEWNISIIDWGTASTINHTPTESHVIGTVQFMSYEQVTNQSLDGRTDVYSLGVLMALLAYGEHLTPRYMHNDDGTEHERTSDEIADVLARGETIKYTLLPEPQTDEEKHFQKLLQRMTQWDRTLRYPTLRAVMADL